jgi:MarR family transcriptional regulator for hemolysin
MSTTSEHVRASFPGLVGKLSRQWRRAIDAQLQPLGLTEATWMALLHISRAKETMRQKDLALSLGLDNSSVVRLLSTLEMGGYIERQEGKTDRRAKTLTLTPVGKATVAKVEHVSAEAHRCWLGGVSDADLEVAYQALVRISDAVSRSMGGKA